jgi:hypothetical protein
MLSAAKPNSDFVANVAAKPASAGNANHLISRRNIRSSIEQHHYAFATENMRRRSTFFLDL